MVQPGRLILAVYHYHGNVWLLLNQLYFFLLKCFGAQMLSLHYHAYTKSIKFCQLVKDVKPVFEVMQIN